MKKQKLMTMEAQLPPEILADILSRLPVKTLIKVKTVCKSWNNMISNPHFLNLHLRQSIGQNRTWFMFLQEFCHATLAYEASQKPIQVGDESNGVEVLASCNGLFCITNGGDDFFLWNPSIREAGKIPSSTIEFPVGSSTWASVFFGLGYHAASDDYKLVRVSMFGCLDFHTEVKIYSRNSNVWRRIGDFPYDFPFGSPGVFVCGCLHWIVYMWENGVRTHKVAALNVAEEDYGLIQLPDFGSKPSYFDIGSLEENLLVYNCSGDHSFDLWILKDYGKTESWTRIKVATDCLNDIEAFLYFQPLCLLKPGEILLRIGIKRVVSYDVKEKRCSSDVLVSQMTESRVISFVESLVSPNRCFVQQREQ